MVNLVWFRNKSNGFKHFKNKKFPNILLNVHKGSCYFCSNMKTSKKLQFFFQVIHNNFRSPNILLNKMPGNHPGFSPE